MLSQLATEVKIPIVPTGEKKEAKDNIITVNSRYGDVSVNLEKAIFFPRGLLGLSQFKDFALTEMPNAKLSQFKLLQSLNDSQLSFVVLPIDAKNGLIEEVDIDECCRVVGVEKQNLLLLLIVTAQQMPEKKLKITTNVRAPIIIDSLNKVAIQYVFSNSKYEIQHPLSS